MGWCQFCLPQMDEQNWIHTVSFGWLMWALMFSHGIQFKPGSAPWFHWTQITSVNYSHGCMPGCWPPILASNAEIPEDQVENQPYPYPSMSSGPVWPGLSWDTVCRKQHFQFLLPFPNHCFQLFNRVTTTEAWLIKWLCTHLSSRMHDQELRMMCIITCTCKEVVGRLK